MAPPANNPIVLINLTPNQPKLTGLELSTIRSHNAHRHSARRDKARSQPQSIDEEPARRVAARQSHDLALQLFTVENGYHLGPRVSNESIRSDPFDCFPVRSNEKITLAIDHCKHHPEVVDSG
jgi:hypothetical protein